MKFFVDGKEIEVLNDVRVEVYQEDGLRLTLTHEGVVTDYVEDGTVTVSTSSTYEELTEILMEDFGPGEDGDGLDG